MTRKGSAKNALVCFIQEAILNTIY